MKQHRFYLTLYCEDADKVYHDVIHSTYEDLNDKVDASVQLHEAITLKSFKLLRLERID